MVGDSGARVVVAFDCPPGQSDPDVAWCDRNGDGAIDQHESVTGAENRDIGGEVVFELGKLDRSLDRVRLVVGGTNPRDVRFAGR